jgi:hypothetical protein
MGINPKPALHLPSAHPKRPRTGLRESLSPAPYRRSASSLESGEEPAATVAVRCSLTRLRATCAAAL